eukprot:1580671-Prorocentrum_lima.AAC.1
MMNDESANVYNNLLKQNSEALAQGLVWVTYATASTVQGLAQDAGSHKRIIQEALANWTAS